MMTIKGSSKPHDTFDPVDLFEVRRIVSQESLELYQLSRVFCSSTTHNKAQGDISCSKRAVTASNL
jgi:hypothetical protein